MEDSANGKDGNQTGMRECKRQGKENNNNCNKIKDAMAVDEQKASERSL